MFEVASVMIFAGDGGIVENLGEDAKPRNQ